MEDIKSTMVIHNHLDEVDTMFSIMEVPLVNNPLFKWIGVIIRGTYQAEVEDSRWEYDPVSYLWPDVDTYGEYRDDGTSD